jgi:hypothetical protein
MPKYRCLADSEEGFLALIVNYMTHGFYFYSGVPGPGKGEWDKVDRNIVVKYGLTASPEEWSVRRLSGQAKTQYVRFGNFAVVLSTYGIGRFFESESDIRDFRRDPLRVGDYSVSLKYDNALLAKGEKKLRGSVRIHPEAYRRVKAHMVCSAKRWSQEECERHFQTLPFEPYAPVRRQLLNLWRRANRLRGEASLEKMAITCVRLKRRKVKVYREGAEVVIPRRRRSA